MCYRCQCEKCGHQWTTKSNDLPRVCSKCKSVAWNEGCAPAPYVAEAIPDEYVPITLAPEDDLSAFIARAQAKKGIEPMAVVNPVTEAPEVEEWDFNHSPPTQQESGEWLREQYLVSNPKKRRKVVVDEWDYTSIVKVVGG